MLHPLAADHEVLLQTADAAAAQGFAGVVQVPEATLQLVNMAVLNVTGAEVEILLGTGSDGDPLKISPLQTSP